MSWRLWAYVGHHDAQTDPPWDEGQPEVWNDANFWTYRPQTGNAMWWENLSPDDPPAYGMILDGLRINRQLPSDRPWPAMPEIATATFQVVGETMADLAELQRRKPVSLYLYTTPPANGTVQPDVWFHGRISDVVVRPHDLGVVAEVTCVDYLADLAEVVATITDDPGFQDSLAEPHDQAISAANPWSGNVGAFPNPGRRWSSPMMYLRPLSNVEATPQDGEVNSLETLRELLSWASWMDANNELWTVELLSHADLKRPGYAEGTFYNYRLGFTHRVVPKLWRAVPIDRWAVTAGDSDQPGLWYSVDRGGIDTWPPPGTAELPTQLPARFADTGESWGVVMDPDDPTEGTRSMVMSGHLVDMATSWVQRAASDPDNLEIVGHYGRVAVSLGIKPPSTLQLDTQLDQADDAERLGRLYLPDDVVDRWDAETFTWYASREAGRLRFPDLGMPMVVWPVASRWNPTARDWYVGTTGGVDVAVLDGELVAEVTLRAGVREIAPSAGIGLTWDQVPAGVTWDDLKATDSWNDYRLVRGT